VSELGKQARERINADFNVDDPNTPPRVRQKLIAAATLLRAMLAPSAPEARNLHREVQRSSSRRPCNMPKAHRPAYASKAARGTTTVLRAKRHPSTQTAQRGNQPTRAERRSGSGYLTRADRLRTAAPATSSTPAIQAMQRRGRRRATTPGGVGATTVARTAHRRRNPQGPACSAGRSTRRAFLSASASPPRSTSTQGRQTLVYGSMIIAWRASWVAPTDEVIIRNLPLHLADSARSGSSTCRPVRSTNGTTWFAPLWGTSKAHTWAPRTPKTCGIAPRSPASRFGTSYGASPSTAPSTQA
jgi:hypothetical protein